MPDADGRPEGGPVKHYLDAMKKYATFSGRATRKEYWAVIGFL